MIRDAETHAEEDRRFHELVAARNGADALVHRARQALEAGEPAAPAAGRERVESAIGALEEAARGRDREAIEERARALETALGGLEASAEGASATGGAGRGDRQDAADDDVIDAEFEEGSAGR